MVVYNFKQIKPVPTNKDFVDIVLSKTQRGTPTVVHPAYHISRIRAFYMRKVRFTQQTYHDRLSQILEDFPIMDEIHPFYADLMNVLYDKDHYKLALGQLNTARHLIDALGKDYVRLLKYGDSLYRCKQLKRAALGRMCTLMRKQGPALAYLEQVRQHLARLPSIDPNARTLILCGYPNVGKSSLMNKLTRADVDVQPYAFTTKSLFVGHMDYKYIRWQVIDTPGILDHPLEERNTIEMQSVTALAHLNAAIVYIVDISEQCGYTLQQQVSLFESIKPLFANKPLTLVANKVDVVRLQSLSPESRTLLDKTTRLGGAEFVEMSTLTEEGVAAVKQNACDKLLEMRVETKLKTKNAANILDRLHLAVPAPRDSKERPPFIPDTVLAKKQAGQTDIQEQKKLQGGVFYEHEVEPREEDRDDWDPTKFSIDYRKDYLLKNEDWKFDNIPEIVDGKNIADFIDPDILERLEELEREEEERMKKLEEQMDDEDDIELDEEDLKELKKFRDAKKIQIQENQMKRTKHSAIPRSAKVGSVDEFEEHLTEMGIDPSTASSRARSKSKSRPRGVLESHDGRKRKRDDSTERAERGRSASKTPKPGEGYRNVKQKLQAEKLSKKSQKARNHEARAGEADRAIRVKMPKHLFSGKRGLGKTERR